MVLSLFAMYSKLKLPEGDPIVPYVPCYVGIITRELPNWLVDWSCYTRCSPAQREARSEGYILPDLGRSKELPEAIT